MHGDGVKVIALSVPDVEHAYREATSRGATGVREPWEETDEGGTIRFAQIATYGETLHTFVDRSEYTPAPVPPRLRRATAVRPATSACSRSTTSSATSSSARWRPG